MAPIDPNLAGIFQTLISARFKSSESGEEKEGVKNYLNLNQL